MASQTNGNYPPVDDSTLGSVCVWVSPERLSESKFGGYVKTKYKVGDVVEVTSHVKHFILIEKIPLSIPQIYCIKHLSTGQQSSIDSEMVDASTKLAVQVEPSLVKLLYG